MEVNRVDFGGNTLIDLTGDTLESAEQLLKGIIDHAKDGSVITGQMEAGGGGYDFGGTAVEVVSGSFTVAEDTICNALFPEDSKLQLPFQNTNERYKQRGRWFFLWDITQTSNINSSAADIYNNSKSNQIISVSQFYVSSSNRDRYNGCFRYRYSTLSSAAGYWFGDYNNVYTTDSTRFFGAGRTYQWVAWATKAVWE